MRSSFSCPDCSSPMVEVSEGGVVVDKCPECQAVWFDPDEISKYLKARKAKAVDGVSDSDFRVTAIGAAETCPCCDKPSFQLGSFRGIAFQRCTWCGGIFLNSDQLKSFIRSKEGQVSDSALTSEEIAQGAAGMFL